MVNYLALYTHNGYTMKHFLKMNKYIIASKLKRNITLNKQFSLHISFINYFHEPSL